MYWTRGGWKSAAGDEDAHNHNESTQPSEAHKGHCKRNNKTYSEGAKVFKAQWKIIINHQDESPTAFSYITSTSFAKEHNC